MHVDKRIVSLLSRQTYESFPGAVRELVSNSYDAGARRADLRVDIKRRVLSVKDDGTGMSPGDFEQYLRIAGEKDTRSRTSELNRRRVGQFGVGFLATLPFCRLLHIETTVRNSDAVLQADIPAAQYFDSANRTDVSDIMIPGRIVSDRSRISEGGTTVELVDLTDTAMQYLAERPGARRDSILAWVGLDRLRWELQQWLPIEYEQSSPVAPLLAYEPAPVPMDVFLNGKKLYRNLPLGEILEAVEMAEVADGAVRFKYVMLHNWTTVKPLEARGIQIRVRNVGIGRPHYLGLMRLGRVFSRLNWIYGEVQVFSGLDNAVSVSRDGFIWTKEYEAFEAFITDRVQSLADQLQKTDMARKEIEKEKRGGSRYTARKRAGLISRREIIEQDVEALRKSGYEVERVQRKPGFDESVRIDTAKKRVLIVEDHPNLEEHLQLGRRGYRVRLSSWTIDDDLAPACRLIGRDLLEFNKEYPPFKSGWDSDVLKRVHAVLAEAQRDFPRERLLLEYLNKRLLEVFTTKKGD
jgi:hypothetical protein